jgi:hypothetical protein
MNEGDIMRSIMLAPHGAVLWRNNTGAVKDSTGRLIRFGLCKGSSDLIGLRSVTVTPDMVGQRVAVFAAIEVKTPTGKPTAEQINFIGKVNEAGGIAGIARSPEDAMQILQP